MTLPLEEKAKLPLSVYEAIKNNLKVGLHTLILLDIDVEHGKFLGVNEGLKLLLKLEEEYKEGIVDKHTKVVVLSMLGSSKSKIVWGKVKDLLSLSFELPAVIIIPGKLHFIERQLLEKFKLV